MEQQDRTFKGHRHVHTSTDCAGANDQMEEFLIRIYEDVKVYNIPLEGQVINLSETNKRILGISSEEKTNERRHNN